MMRTRIRMTTARRGMITRRYNKLFSLQLHSLVLSSQPARQLKLRFKLALFSSISSSSSSSSISSQLPSVSWRKPGQHEVTFSVLLTIFSVILRQENDGQLQQNSVALTFSRLSRRTSIKHFSGVLFSLAGRTWRVARNNKIVKQCSFISTHECHSARHRAWNGWFDSRISRQEIPDSAIKPAENTWHQRGI